MLLKRMLLFFFIACSINVCAQKKDIPDSLRQLVLAARFHSGFIFAHNIFVQNTKGTHPNGFELEYSRLRTDSATVTKFKCYPRTGFSFTYTDFNKDILGKAYSLSYFLEPNYRLGNNLNMVLRASAGLSYLTNPYSAVTNPANQSYSGNINTLLQLGLGLSYAVSNHFAVYAMGNFFHNSNGGFKMPNSGVNYINASIGLRYYTFSSRLPVYKRGRDTSWKHQGIHVDASAYYSPKGGYKGTAANYKSVRRFVLGTSLTAVKQVSVLNAITLCGEVYYDDALRSTKQIFIADSSSNIFAGILVGHRFLLNRFTFTQEFGFYVFKQTAKYNISYRNLYRTTYQRWGLYYNVKKRWSIGINLLAHYEIADFIDGRVIYRLK